MQWKHWRPIAFGLAIGTVGLTAAATARAEAIMIDSFDSHARWQEAAVLPSLQDGAIAYGELAGLGQGRYYRLAVKTPVKLNIELANTTDEKEKFVPQLVVFQPEPDTIGPLLPIEQPPNTLALVYRSERNDLVFDASTQTSYRRRFYDTINLPVAGTYYLAVYSTDGEPGRFRLALRSNSPPRLGPDQFIPHWWRAQTWAGLGWPTLFLPLVISAILALAVWRSVLLIHAPAKRRGLGKK